LGQFETSISYPGNKIFAGAINLNSSNPTALDSLTTAAAQINLLYEIKNTSLGQFVYSINGYAPSGASGWQYAVNSIVPNSGAANYQIKNGDRIQWFYGQPNTQPY
jgi:hypothetical protein